MSEDINVGAISEALNNKMDRDGVNAVASVCIESYQSGTSWYRVYSDGWCEQGGHYTNTSTQTVSFLKTFSNTNYCVYFGKSGNDSQPIVAQAIDRNTSGFTLTCAYNGSYTGYQRSYFWKACGYIR